MFKAVITGVVEKYVIQDEVILEKESLVVPKIHNDESLNVFKKGIEGSAEDLFKAHCHDIGKKFVVVDQIRYIDEPYKGEDVRHVGH